MNGHRRPLDEPAKLGLDQSGLRELAFHLGDGGCWREGDTGDLDPSQLKVMKQVSPRQISPNYEGTGGAERGMVKQDEEEEDAP